MELTAGYLRVAASAPEVAIADPERNAERIVAALERASADGAALLLLPELALTGYSCEDLFASSTLLSANHRALAHLVRATRQRRTVLVVGAPWLLDDGRLLNCAFVIARGGVCGAVPKTALPNQGEYYEKRWFVSGDGVQQTVVDPKLGRFDMDVRQIFRIAHARFGVEVCEHL